MKNALSVTASALAVTSQLLAIGIEIGVIAGGFYIYKKVKAELGEEEKQELVVVERQPYPAKVSFKEKLAKAKKIIKAVIE